MADKIKVVIRETGRITAAVGGRDTTPAKWRGKWQPEERYGTLHKVEHLGSSYVCIKACQGVDPEADVTLGDGVEGQYWILIAKCGEDGAPFTYDMFTEEQLAALRGPEGPAGKDGQDGSTGPRGPAGRDGQDGADGEDGNDGATFYPNVDADGNLSWTNDGGLENPSTVNVRGPQGERGPKGDPGEGGEPEIFIATYGETTYADIRAAHDAGKMCFCVKQQSTAAWFVLPLVLINNMNATFCTVRNSTIMAKNVTRNNIWVEDQETVLFSTGGTMTGALTLAADPTEDLHAATKAYVDAQAAGGAPEVFTAIYGETLYEDIMAAHDAGKLCVCNYNGNWHFGAVFTNVIRFTAAVAGQAVRVVSVTAFDVWEASTQTLLKKNGDSMTGYLTLHADPTDAMHAATKQYVDNATKNAAEDWTFTLEDGSTVTKKVVLA